MAKKIDFRKVKVFDSIDRSKSHTEDLSWLADQMYKTAGGIAYMSLALKIYEAKGEIEIDDKEEKLLLDFVKPMPPIIADSLKLI